MTITNILICYIILLIFKVCTVWPMVRNIFYKTSESIKLIESRGGEDWHLIDQVDGFHPSQTAMVLQTR